jgi:hypothetical protein
MVMGVQEYSDYRQGKGEVFLENRTIKDEIYLPDTRIIT